MQTLHRRRFLADMGMGVTGMALGSLLTGDARGAPPNGKPHFAPRARSVIWLFMIGGIGSMCIGCPLVTYGFVGGEHLSSGGRLPNILLVSTLPTLALPAGSTLVAVSVSCSRATTQA